MYTILTLIYKLKKVSLLAYFTYLFCCINVEGYSQSISINEDGSAPHSSAILDIGDTTKGVLISRMTSDQMNAITTPANGLLIYNTDLEMFHYYDGGAWNELLTTDNLGAVVSSAADSTRITDADQDTKIEVELTDDDDTLRFYTGGNQNMIIDPSGNVGIGTTIPTGKLTVNGSIVRNVSTVTVGNDNNINDLSVGGDADVIRLDGGNSNFNLSGIEGGVDGRVIQLINVSDFSIILQHDEATSLEVNRFYLYNETNLTLIKYSSVMLMYSAIDGKWFMGYY